MNTTDTNAVLTAGELGALRRLAVLPRGRVTGRYDGRHRADRRGRSVEFADYRAFVAGDSPGEVDWKVYARSDRLYVKRFERRAQASVVVVVDGSASMDYAGLGPGGRGRASEGMSKFAFASKVACALAVVLTRQRDRVGLVVSGVGLSGEVELGGGLARAAPVAEAVAGHRPTGGTGLAGALLRVDRMARRERVSVVVVSDLYEDREEVVGGLRRLRARGHDAAVVHVLHGDELALPGWGAVEAVDSETGARVRLDTAGARRAYERRLAAWRARWATEVRGAGARFVAAPMPAGWLAAMRELGNG